MNPIKYLNSYLKVINNNYLSSALNFFILMIIIVFFLPALEIVDDAKIEEIYALIPPLFNFANILNIEQTVMGITWIVLLVGFVGAFKVYKDEKIAIVFKGDHVQNLKRFSTFKEKIPGIFYALLINAFGLSWMYFFNLHAAFVEQIATDLLNACGLEILVDFVDIIPFFFVFAGVPFCLPLFLACGLGALLGFFIGVPWFILGGIFFVPFLLIHNEFSVVKMVEKEIENKILEALS